MTKNNIKNIVKLEFKKMKKILLVKLWISMSILIKCYQKEDTLKNKKCLRIDNWVSSTTYLEWALVYHIIINVNMQNIMAVINNKIRVAYRLPTKFGSIYGNRRIEKIYDGLIKFKGVRYPYKLCNFTYLKLVHKYKTKIREIDLRYVRFTND